MQTTFLFAVVFAAFFVRIAGAQSTVEENPAFRQLVPADAVVEKVADGCQFLEGPAYDARTNSLIYSDIPASRLYQRDLATGKTTVFREPSEHTNGNTFNAAGELISCEHGSRRVTLRRADGKVETLAERFDGHPLNSPNDAVVARDGAIWFTDPPYGLEGRAREQSACRVYRLDPKTGDLRAVAEDFDGPNGLCFSPDGSRLYIADSGRPHHVRVFDVTADGRLANGRVFCVIRPGVPDGMRCDGAGNLFTSAGDGVQVFNPDGVRLGKILVPETPANLSFAGPAGEELYMTARTSLYRIKLKTPAPPAKE